MAVIGVDLGTTNSLCCVWRGGKCVLIPNSLGDCLTPSVVSVDDNGDILTGRIAKERRISHPNQTAASFKQFMGTDKIYQLGSMRFRPEELSSLILRRLKEDAEVFLGEQVTEAVISVPAYFNNNQRTMTKLAGELAGLRVERIINEPSAAALAYRNQSGTGGVYLVVDFGGGTLDISVVDIFENIVDIIAVAGDNHLGGDNIDEAIAGAFYDRHPALKEQLSDSEKASVRKMAEQCKINLTSAEQAMMIFVHGGQTYDLLLTNQTLADVCAPILAKIRSLLLRVLKDSGRHIGLIDDIILVGGSGKMPVVQTYLAHITGKLPRCDIDPDKAIALGVGIVTGIKARDEQIRDVIMTDICPFTLGTRVYNPLTKDRNEYSPVIERNTSLPVSRVQIYATISDYQATMGLDIYQGESSSVLNNVWLGKLDMPIPPAPAGQAQVTLRFTYDINGILEVEATSLQSGETRKKLIVTNKDLSDSEISGRLDVLQQLKIPPRELDRNRLLLERGARLYEESTGDQREMVRNEMTLFEMSLELTHPAEKEMARSRFLQFLDLSDHFDEELYLRGDV
jgi:molecular chaperone HscC